MRRFVNGKVEDGEYEGGRTVDGFISFVTGSDADDADEEEVCSVCPMCLCSVPCERDLCSCGGFTAFGMLMRWWSVNILLIDNETE